MADQVRVVDFFRALVGDTPGEGRRLLEHISEKGINLQVFSAYPVGQSQTQLNFVTDRIEKLKEAARDAGVELSGPERALLIQGEDRIGALHAHHLTLANAGVNVLSSSCISDGAGRFGLVIWVLSEDFERAALAFDFI